MKPNILICGKTGVGKTSLIQAVTHAGTVPDEAIGHAQPTTTGFDVYETEAANFIDCQGMEPGQTVDEYAVTLMSEVVKRLDTEQAENLIHNIWYCIDASGARLQNADAKLITQFSEKVLLVITKAELLRKDQIGPLMEGMLQLLPPERIVLISSAKKNGLQQLLDKAQAMTENALENANGEVEGFRTRWEVYYARMRMLWMARMDAEADECINWGAGRAAAIALMPLPLADVGPLIANEAYMIYKLGAVYGYAINKAIFTMLAGVTGGSIAGKLAASFIPFLKIPIAAGITYGVGKAAKAYFESGMSLKPEELRNMFLEAEQEAKNINWKEKTQKED